MPTYGAELKRQEVEVDIRYESYDAPHPNFYRLELVGESGRTDCLGVISTGGGMIELMAVDGVPLKAAGDLELTLFWLDAEPSAGEWVDHPATSAAEAVCWHAGLDRGLLDYSSGEPIQLSGSSARASTFGTR